MQWHNTALDRRSRLCCSTGRVLCNTVEKCNEEAVATWPGERLKRRRVSELRWWGWCNVWELWIGFYYPQWQIFFSHIHTLRVWLKDTLTQMSQLVTDQLSCSCDKNPHKTQNKNQPDLNPIVYLSVSLWLHSTICCHADIYQKHDYKAFHSSHFTTLFICLHVILQPQCVTDHRYRVIWKRKFSQDSTPSCENSFRIAVSICCVTGAKNKVYSCFLW